MHTYVAEWEKRSQGSDA